MNRKKTRRQYALFDRPVITLFSDFYPKLGFFAQ